MGLIAIYKSDVVARFGGTERREHVGPHGLGGGLVDAGVDRGDVTVGVPEVDPVLLLHGGVLGLEAWRVLRKELCPAQTKSRAAAKKSLAPGQPLLDPHHDLESQLAEIELGDHS
jgi:hypothetical protein